MAPSKSALPALSPDGNLSRYLEQIRAFPMLEPEQSTFGLSGIQSTATKFLVLKTVGINSTLR